MVETFGNKNSMSDKFPVNIGKRCHLGHTGEGVFNEINFPGDVLSFGRGAVNDGSGLLFRLIAHRQQ